MGNRVVSHKACGFLVTPLRDSQATAPIRILLMPLEAVGRLANGLIGPYLPIDSAA
ncbi:hypothetical protein FBY36_0812 [Arthrobacter sp. SLBN-122]|nr:hypothetical protein FBY36_0812 [Arthrobacter sp. SLBN-122]